MNAGAIAFGTALAARRVEHHLSSGLLDKAGADR
jgi:hypothetical protein